MADEKDPKYLEKRIARDEQAQKSNMEAYYRFHAMIYDLTRWTFLFGRNSLVNHFPFDREEKFTMLEVGCGTGHNLRNVRRHFPNAHLIGLDVSRDMLSKAQKKMADSEMEWHNKPYLPEDDSFKGKVDLILFSYALTMINPQWKDLVKKASDDLKPGGYIAAVDFHDSTFKSFKAHMANNHVKMESHILPKMEELFSPVYSKVKPAYLGAWEYFTFVGKKK
jgi:S-adenosylmethionine-diacylgycerolhomoserine-N-methlytransferase